MIRACFPSVRHSLPIWGRVREGLLFTCINMRKWVHKHAVELSLSKSATFAFQKLPFQLLKVPLLQAKSSTFGKPYITHWNTTLYNRPFKRALAV